MKSEFYHIPLGLLLIVSLFLRAGSVTAQDAAAPPHQRTTLMQYVIDERPVLAELITVAGLAPVLSGSSPYTLLVPPEERLHSLKGQPAEKIRAVLAMHIIKGKYKETDFKEGAKTENYSGDALHVCRKGGSTLLNGVGIRTADQDVRNGVIHELNDLLIP